MIFKSTFNCNFFLGQNLWLVIKIKIKKHFFLFFHFIIYTSFYEILKGRNLFCSIVVLVDSFCGLTIFNFNFLSWTKQGLKDVVQGNVYGVAASHGRVSVWWRWTNHWTLSFASHGTFKDNDELGSQGKCHLPAYFYFHVNHKMKPQLEIYTTSIVF